MEHRLKLVNSSLLSDAPGTRTEAGNVNLGLPDSPMYKVCFVAKQSIDPRGAMSRSGFAMSTLRSNGDGRAKVVRGLTYGKANLDSSCVLVGASSWIYSRLSRAVKAARWPGCELPSQVCEAASLQRCRNRKAEDKAATCVKKEGPGSGKLPKLTVLMLKAFSRLKEIVSLHFQLCE